MRSLPSLANIILNSCQYTRFVDRDMLMRHHWSLAIGHTYAHAQPHQTQELDTTRSTFEDDVGTPEMSNDMDTTRAISTSQDIVPALGDCAPASEMSKDMEMIIGTSQVIVPVLGDGSGTPELSNDVEMAPIEDDQEPDPDDPQLGLDERENEDLGMCDDMPEYGHDVEDDDDELFETYEM